MSHAITSHRHPRTRTTHERSLLAQSVFSTRRFLSRMSWTDVGAVLLVWGNLIGLVAYPALSSRFADDKASTSVPAVEQLVSK